jgi:FAD synthase
MLGTDDRPMRAEVQGSSNRAAVVVVGAWEPLIDSHFHLFRRLAKSARSRGQCSCVVIIYPSPAELLHRPGAQPHEYDDLESRRSLIRSRGIDSVVVVYFKERDLSCDAEEFLGVVRDCVDLRELWLGATQSLGSGPDGSQSAIECLADQMGFKLRMLAPQRDGINAHQVWEHLAKGKVDEASSLVGHAPIRSRPATGSLKLLWPRGAYPAIPLSKPVDVFSRRTAQQPLTVDVKGRADAPRMLWPAEDVEWLAFVGNPVLAR